MVLSLVNLQETYAKALLVDTERLEAAQRAGDVLGGHGRCSTPTGSTSGRCARRFAPSWVRPRTHRGRCAPPVTWSALPPNATAQPGADPMSTVAAVVDHVEDLWPEEGVPGGALEQLVVASNLLGADRAVSNFGGWEHVGEGDGGRSRGA